MDKEEQNLFWDIMSLGYACGLETVHECFHHYLRTLGQYTNYEDIPEKEDKIINLFKKFLVSSSSSPEEESYRKNLDKEKLTSIIRDRSKL